MWRYIMKGIEIIKHEESGFKPLITYESWRVAVLNYSERVGADSIYCFEKHTKTDEVFILLKGNAHLIVIDNNYNEEKVDIIKMQETTVYNVKKDTWHHVIMSKDCSILIVENEDTGSDNTQYREADEIMQMQIKSSIRIC